VNRSPVAPEFGRERLVFFSDAVFAIAITLLALDVRVPEIVGTATNEAVAAAVGDLAPRIFAYALSFAVVGLFWLAHWRRYLLIEHVDEGLVLLNIILLGFVALIPFPTALLGEHGDVPISVVVYALILSATGFMGTVTWVYADQKGLIDPDLSRYEVTLGALRGLAVPIVMLASLALLPIASTTTVEATWIAIFPVQSLIRCWARALADRRPAPDEPAPDPPRRPPGSAPG
jgi:uncharacterized membrane protein